MKNELLTILAGTLFVLFAVIIDVFVYTVNTPTMVVLGYCSLFGGIAMMMAAVMRILDI